MPTLKKAADGHHYITHRHEDVNTWQATARAVACLRRRGVGIDGKFGTTFFMRLREAGLVYHGATCPPFNKKFIGDVHPEELRDAAEKFTAAVKVGDWQVAASYTFQCDFSDIVDLPHDRYPPEYLDALKTEHESRQRELFVARVRVEGYHDIRKWALVDVRKSLLDYIVTFEIDVPDTGASRCRTLEWDQQWVELKQRWQIMFPPVDFIGSRRAS